jgi:hypothetical protein
LAGGALLPSGEMWAGVKFPEIVGIFCDGSELAGLAEDYLGFVNE